MNNIVEDEEMADALNKAAALAGYMGLFAAVTKGLLPRSWLGSNSDNKAQFKFLMYSIAGDIHDLTSPPRRRTRNSSGPKRRRAYSPSVPTSTTSSIPASRG